MIETGFSPRVQIQDIIDSQLPEFIVSDNPKFSEFLKQYYISQEYQGGPVDLSDNLDQYLNIDSLLPEVIVDRATLSSNIDSSTTTIQVSSTKGYPESYGLFKIDDEIITYTSKTSTEFQGCVRGFSGVTGYDYGYNKGELIFSESSSASHIASTSVSNLSSLFLHQFYKKLKYALSPGLEGFEFDSNIDVRNFIKEAKTFYQSKGTEESFRILFGVLFGESPKVVDLEKYLIKPSSANNLRRLVILTEVLSGNPLNLEGQTIYKNIDSNTYATVSEVDIIQRGEKVYYRMLLFYGYDDSFPPVFGDFVITGNTKNTTSVSIGASNIIVDTTIGFPKTGTLTVGNNNISYSDKSINEFLGCSGITEEVGVASTITSNETYYGCENGDLSKKVVFRITGIISGYKSKVKNAPVSVGEEVTVKSIGEKIKNEQINPTRKQVFANSWVYNSSSRIQIDTFGSGTISQITLKKSVDKCQLKVGDRIDILFRDSQTAVVENLEVNSIFGNQVGTSNAFSLSESARYDIRKRINFADFENVDTEYDNIFADIQNVYNENDEYMYVASNSTPSYTVTKKLFSYNVSSLHEFNEFTGKYGIIQFGATDKVSFLTGTEVVYTPSGDPIEGLVPGTYFVETLSNNTIRLYASSGAIRSGDYLRFGSLPSGTHNFIPLKQQEKVVSPQKVFKKFPLNPNIGDGESTLTAPGAVGMLINGVEIYGYKSNDKIYYGPLTSVDILNGGSGYDVINPPIIEPSFGTAKIQPIITGSVVDAFVDPLDFDVDKVISIGFSGGNGTGASFEPIIENRRREILFNAKQLTEGGGVDVDTDTLTFSSPHKLSNGEAILYDPGVYAPLGIGTYLGSNSDSGDTLIKDSEYYVRVISDVSILLYEKITDYNAGINTVGFTTIGTAGIQKFLTKPKRQLVGLQVINGGSKYENRLLRVQPSGISTNTDRITSVNHGFSDGELINYTYETSGISGVSTDSQYYVLKVNDDVFSIADAGIGATISSNYERRKPVKFEDTGSGYQMFKYPDFNLNVKYTAAGVGSTVFTSAITATPVIRGEITGTYVYDGGSNIGSEILNYENNPNIIVKNGKNAILSPIITNGQITDVFVQSSGSEYFSIPNITASGDGNGAKFRPVIANGKLTDVVVVSPGIGYSTSNTVISVESAGKNAVLRSNIRSLSANNNVIFNDADDTLAAANELLISTPNNNLQYAVCAYSDTILNQFNDDGTEHSPIIGWAYDGNPIYGSFGYTDPSDINSDIKRLVSGYSESISNIENRPTSFGSGFFTEDYVFDNSGDLDEYNGRFCLTPEFPKGTYAYFAPSVLDGDGNVKGVFPYFVGNRYRSPLLQENIELDQDFDFNQSDLIRNTFPYSVTEEFADNDFIVESNEEFTQSTRINSISTGSIEEFDIIDPGSNYKVGDILNFDEEKSGGSGLFASVQKIKGKPVNSLDVSTLSYENAIFTKKDNQTIEVKISPSHDLQNLDNVIISGFSTVSTELSGFYQIGVSSVTSTLVAEIPSASGTTVDISLSRIPDSISMGSKIGIGTERLTIRNIFGDLNVIRVSREYPAIAHTATSTVSFIPDKFTFSKTSDFFESSYNDLVYFNPTNALGVGTTPGAGISTTYNIGVQTNHTVSIPTQSIYLPNHPFRTNQKVTFKKEGLSALGVANTSDSAIFNLPSSGEQQDVYIIRKSHDHIGIVTQIGLTTTTDGLFFRNYGTDSPLYNFESNYFQSLANVKKVTTTVSVSTAHEMVNGDVIELEVKPNLSVGIGTSTAVRIKYDQFNEKILVNSTEFLSTGINTITNQINIEDHGFSTGEKVIYTSATPAVGLETGSFFVYKVDDDNLQLCETLPDSLSNPPIVVGIATAPAATHELSHINPPLKVISNNNIVFDVSDSSLIGYNFKIFYDNTFKDEFVSTASTNAFSVTGISTVGYGTASVTVIHDSLIPSPLYYGLEKSGFISTADVDVQNYSQITYEDSLFNGEYAISGVGETTFNISHSRIPETTSYLASQCDTIEYKTRSTTSSGGISDILITSPGSGYESLPKLLGSNSVSGAGAAIVANSKGIGDVNQLEVLNEGFDYSSDLTLRPLATIPKQLITKNSNTVNGVEVLDGGKNFIGAPDLILINKNTGELVDSGFISAELSGSTIISANVESEPKGVLEGVFLDVRSINNTNGVAVNVYTGSVNSGIVSATLATPLNGFSVEPFKVGDLVYVEGLTRYDSQGDGFNSEDHGYAFFPVVAYSNAGTNQPRVLQYDISRYSTGAGIGLTGNVYGTIINYENYPKFEVNTIFSEFLINESVEVLQTGGFTLTDSRIVSFEGSVLKISGDYVFNSDDIIRGVQSGSIATVDEVNLSEGIFDIQFSILKDFGWQNDIGKLNNDTQIIEDNDYYQNLSYTIKTRKTWDDVISPVNNLVHPSGLKNFVDTEILQPVGVVTTTSTESSISIHEIMNEKRVDAINNFDLVRDSNTFDQSSKFIEFANEKLTDYVEVRTNRVLEIDDISDQFSNNNLDIERETNLEEIPSNRQFSKFLVQATSADYSQVMFSEVMVLNNNQGRAYTLSKASLTNFDEDFAEITSFTNTQGEVFLQFSPTEVFNTSYNVKHLNTGFTNFVTGVSSITVGFVDIIGVTTTVSAGTTTTVLTAETGKKEAIHSYIHVLGDTSREMNYVELLVDHDGENTNIAEFYFDTDEGDISNSPIGSFDASIEDGILSLNYSNTTGEPVVLRTRNVGFGTTVTGIGTYRFQKIGQPEGDERSITFDSQFVNTSIASTTIKSFDISEFTSMKSTVRVSVGETSALHQVMVITDTFNVNQEAYTLQYPFLSIGSTSGIGTFGMEMSGFNGNFKFYPDPEYVGAESIQISSFNENFYHDYDTANLPEDLQYGNILESMTLSKFLSANDDDLFKTTFDLTYDGIPIFVKTFNPTDSSVIDISLDTSTLSIDDHFFSTGEELVYTPGSTFTSIEASPIQIVETENYLGVTTTLLPSTVYAIKINNGKLKLATTRENADAGIAVTFSSIGDGNAHNLEMKEKVSKTLITVDNLIQSPIAYSLIRYQNVGGEIGVGDSMVHVSGISSIILGDLLKVDDEYLKVLNVGLGTTASGPISFGGTFPLVNVERGVAGTISTSHTQYSDLDLYRGSYTITENQIHFTDAPAGILEDQIFEDVDNLPEGRSQFFGRTFLRLNYDSNQIFDNISEKFTGLDQRYTLTSAGVNTVGLGTSGGAGIILINGIYQAPTTSNNQNNNFNIEEDLSVGITSVVFSGITSANGQIIISPDDVNQNQLPRGGVIVSLGSTPGLGYAPLFGASVLPLVGAGGSIVDVVGIPTYGTALGISTVSYDNESGYMDITTDVDHNLNSTDLWIEGLKFSCDEYYDGPVVNISNFVYDNLTGIATVTTSGDSYATLGKSVRLSDILMDCNSYEVGISTLNISDVDYDNLTGIVTVTTSSAHGLEVSNPVKLDNIEFTCNSYTGFVTFTANNLTYTESTGIVTITTDIEHGISVGEWVQLSDFELSCSVEHAGVTTTIFPHPAQDGYPQCIPNELTLGNTYNVVRAQAGTSGTSLVLNVGVSTIAHTYASGGEVMTGITSTTFPYEFGKTQNNLYGSFNIWEITEIVSTTEFEINVGVSSIYHTYASGGTVTVGITSSVFPYPGGNANNSYDAYDVFEVTSIASPSEFTVNVGISTIIHEYVSGGTVKSGVTTTIFPDGTLGNIFSISEITGDDTLRVNIGISSFSHTYIGLGSVRPYYRDLNLGSGYREPVSIAITDSNHSGSDANIVVEVDRNDHKFVSATTNNVTRSIGGTLSISSAHYETTTGVLQLYFTGAHGLTTSDTIVIADNSMTFTCSEDFHRTQLSYPRSTDPASGANLEVLSVISSTGITVNVGASLYGTGGRLKFRIVDGGTGYTVPRIDIEHPTYSNLTLVGQSRVGLGTTTDTGFGMLVNLDVGNSDRNTNGDRFFDAANLIEANKEFIADIAYGRMVAAFPGFVTPTGNPQDCKDDIEDVLESMLYNLKYGGNDLTVDAANLYVTGAHVSGEEAESVYAFIEAKDMAIQAMRNEVITVGGYTTKTQVFDYTITIDSETPYCANVASAIHTLVGIVTTAVQDGIVPKRTVAPGAQYVVEDFDVSRKGYGFKKGDVMRAVGLVTALGLLEPIKHFEISVEDVFSDAFSAWQFGQIDYVDPIDEFQDGSNTRFDLRYNGELLSFEKNRSNADSQVIDFAPLLIIFLNGILQQPKVAYEFEGGTTVKFSNPPKTNDKVSIFFYRGSEADSSLVLVNQVVKIGDDVQIFSDNNKLGITTTQDTRTITRFSGFDIAQTNLYSGEGIDEDNQKPVTWIKQKKDMILEGEIISKSRDSIETQVYPTARIIDNVTSGDSEIFVDNAQFFNYEDPSTVNFDGIILPSTVDPVAAGVSVVVSSAGTVQSLLILESGSGYVGSALTVSISAPPRIGVGVGTTAKATVTIINGSITSSTITEPGFGYSQNILPQAIIPQPSPIREEIAGITNVEGFGGSIVGIATTTGIGTDLAISFTLDGTLSPFAGLSTNYRIYVYDSHVGNGLTSILNNDTEVIGTGTTCVDNIYNVSAFDATVGIITCNIDSNSNTVGIATTGSLSARFSWGRLSGFSRASAPISIGVSEFVVDAGLSTFPVIQRRGFGLRDLGALSKDT